MNMGENIFGTIKGQIITPEILDEYSLRFEQDWQDSEVIVKPTRYGKALEALQSLEMSVGEIEALERKAQHYNKPLPFFLRSVLQNELVR